ncbi:MAG TPA: hypothetical protein VGO71_15495 [Baekduia sp.]|nr:hypothetical protein [Baekduia sp.]
MSFRTPIPVARAVLLAAVLVAPLLAATPALADSAVTSSLAAEQLHGSHGVVRAVRDSRADGRRALLLRGPTTVVTTIRPATAATLLAVRVRARRCHGGPVLRVGLDGRTVLRRRIASRRYVVVSTARAIAAGPHRLTLALSRGLRRGAHCRRALVIDTVSTLATAAAGAAPATGPAPAAPGSSTTTPAPTTVAPGSTPGAALPGVIGPRLRWAPPALTAPTTIAVADGDQWYELAAGRDYIIKLPPTVHRGTLGFEGGRHVTIVGGHIALPAGSTKTAALEIRNNAGTVHVEGLWIDGSSGYQADGVRISSPSSVVQLENVRATGLRGSTSGAHADIVQPYGGVKALRIDRLSGTTNYQGLYLPRDLGAIGSIDLSNVDLAYDDVGSTDGGYLLWLAAGCTAVPTKLSNVYVKPSASKRLATSVWPSVYTGSCPAALSGSTISWPGQPITGSASTGPPPGGSFVSPAAAGEAYISPGYG